MIFSGVGYMVFIFVGGVVFYKFVGFFYFLHTFTCSLAGSPPMLTIEVSL